MQNVVEMRAKQLNIRLSDEEADRLERVAKHYGLNAAGVIRFLLKREDDAVGERARHPIAGPIAGPIDVLSEALEIVHRSGLAGIELAIRDDYSDVMRRRFSVLRDGRSVGRDLDLSDLERVLDEQRKEAPHRPPPASATSRPRTKKR